MISVSDDKEKINRSLIKLTHGKVAKIDPVRHTDLNRHYWRAVKSGHCWYAVRREIRGGKVWTIKMHREIAKTPPDMVCHHKNGDSLDNRRINLDNMYPLDHKMHHIVYSHQKKATEQNGTDKA